MNSRIDPFDAEKKPLVIYHDNCLDGFTAAWIFYHKYGDAFEIIPGQYQSNSFPDFSNRHIFLVDFSYPKAIIYQILEQCKTLTIYDHHKSAIEELKDIGDPKLFMDFDIEKSGAEIVWQNLYPGVMPPDIVEYTADRDLWKFNLNQSKEYNEGLFSRPRTFAEWDIIHLSKSRGTDKLINEGDALLKKFNTDLERLLTNSATYGMVEGYLVPFVNLPPLYASEAGNRLSKGNPFAIVYWLSGGELQVSLRSDNKSSDSIDVSEIAKFWGGGGHKNAAGFRLNNPIEILDFIERTIEQ